MLAIPACARADQDGSEVCVVTTFVEVVQVQCIIHDLIHVLRGERVFSDLELQHEDYWTNDAERIDSPAHARNTELEIQSAHKSGECALKDFGLREPRVPLGQGEIEGVLAHHSAKDLIPIGRAEFT